MFKRLNPELEATKRIVDQQRTTILALESELAWMTNERNKLHRIVQAARDGFGAMHAALFPDVAFVVSPDWSDDA